VGVKALGYVVIRTAKMAEWDRFLTQVAGVMRGDSPAEGVCTYRIDSRPFRFWIERGDTEWFAAAAYEVGSAAELEELAGKVAAVGRPVTRGSAEQARQRGVEAFFATSDPAGNGLEFYHGDSRDDVPFVSPVGVKGFVTGELGMGHAVFAAPNFEETHAFYRDVIGLGDTDLPTFHLMGPEGPAMHFAFMHAEGGRHHSLALGEGPVPPSGCVHIMLEMLDLTEVGKAYDRMRAEGFAQSASLGRHVNDEVTGFYVQTPGGFDLEIGYGGLVVDPESWVPTAHEQISVWGHRWAWQDAMEAATK
jgi:3,4-dihydroxy-9,10-secoandrosta-1,3,5(10)-triene-9,17-dione 4,5-dioxygenase